MAIRRGSRVVSTLEQLLGDLPQLMLGMQAQSERSQIAREEMKAREEASLRELQLSNLNYQIQLSRGEIESGEKEIEGYETELANFTSFIPPPTSVHSTGDAAIDAITQITNAEITTVQEGIDQRKAFVSQSASQASEVEARRQERKRDAETARMLKAKMAQGRAVLAAGGIDPYLVEAGDMEAFWKSTLVPELKDRGYSPDEISRYRGMWGGMLGEATSEMDKATKLKNYYTQATQEGLKTLNVYDLNWPALNDEQKGEVLKRTNNMISTVLSPKIAAMDAGPLGGLIEKVGIYQSIKEQDRKVELNPGRPDLWGKATKHAKEELDKEYTRIGVAVSTGRSSSQINVMKFHKDLGERLFKGMLAATDKTMPSEKQLLDALREIELYMRFEISVNSKGKPIRKRDEAGNPILRDKTSNEYKKGLGVISRILGFSVYELNVGTISNILQMYDQKVKWENERIISTLKQPEVPIETNIQDVDTLNTNPTTGSTPFTPAPLGRPEQGSGSLMDYGIDTALNELNLYGIDRARSGLEWESTVFDPTNLKSEMIVSTVNDKGFLDWIL